MGHHQSKPETRSQDPVWSTYTMEQQREKLLKDVHAVEEELTLRKKRKKELQTDQIKAQDKPDCEESGGETSGILSGNPLSGVCWPDPDPVVGDMVVKLDDVTRMNVVQVERIFFVRCIEDIKRVLAMARTEYKNVSIRGTKHSMGGHTLAEGGFVIDMEKLNHMSYDKDTRRIKTGAGAMFSDLVFYLNKFGMSPRTLQSYSSFSVGGSLSANVHGITTDFCLYESVVEFTLVKWDGAMVTCREGIEGEPGELFNLAIGGYGMFGVIADVTFNVQENVRLRMEMLTCTINEFPWIYKNLLLADDVEIKLARIDTVGGVDCQVFVFRRDNEAGVTTVSDLPLDPRKMPLTNRVMYKWILPSAKMLRATIEGLANRALDWSDANERNLLIYESAVPLAKLYSPMHDLDDTFVLQEFFVPCSSFQTWVARAKPHLIKKYVKLTLLNITVRFVCHDDATLLAYSRAEEGSFAFVLYYRIRRNAEADAELQGIHEALADISLDLGGTFYLPYRHHYSDEQLKKAYPNFEKFCERKMYYDPHGIFQSCWSKRYMPLDSDPLMLEDRDKLHQDEQDFELVEVSQHRDDSYRKLMSNLTLRKQFFDAFLIKIFNIENKDKLESCICKAVWDIRNKNDLDIYRSIQKQLNDTDGPVNQLTKVVKSLLQVRAQRHELTKEVIITLERLGRLGHVTGYVSVGDTGKLVLALQETQAISGKVWVVHDDLGDLPGMIERCSQDEVGHFVHIDYKNPNLSEVPADCADLLTLNQGLHHFPQHMLTEFVRDVYRVLKPGGLFIVREHDCSPELIPMLDLAHSVFNAVTGVDIQDEELEVRAFRSILDWRRIIESCGFVDTLLYSMEQGDPTLDEMLCFTKGKFDDHFQDSREDEHSCYEQPILKHTQTTIGIFPPKIGGAIDAAIEQIPNIGLELTRATVDKSIQWIKDFNEFSQTSLTKNMTNGQAFAVNQMVEKISKPLLDILVGFKPSLDQAKLKEGNNIQLVPPEFIIIIKALLDKGERGEATPAELIAIGFIKDVQQFVTGNMNSEEGEDSKVSTSAEINVSTVEGLIDRFLKAHSYLTKMENLPKAGLGHSAQMMVKARLGDENLNAKNLTQKLMPFLDEHSWHEFSTALEELILDPKPNTFNMGLLENSRSPWWRAGMALLGSPKVQFNNYGLTMASMVGLDSIVQMWRVAQEVRASTTDQDTSHTETLDLSTKSRNMLTSAIELVHAQPDSTSLDSLQRCALLSGIIKKRGNNPEITWYKLPEWLQVEYVQTFGGYMRHRPWYQFPFGKMLQEYFRVLGNEAAIVYKKQGLVAAGASGGFMTSLIPGIAMAGLFGQMMLMAVPLRAVAGDDYSPQKLKTQVERLVVLSAQARSPEDWREIYPGIEVTPVVPLLDILTVPSLGEFSKVIARIALRVPDARLLRISDHSEVQVRVSVKEGGSEILHHLEGCKVMFEYRLPVSDTPPSPPPVTLSLCIQATHLLSAIRELVVMDGVRLDQIYDYWF